MSATRSRSRYSGVNVASVSSFNSRSASERVTITTFSGSWPSIRVTVGSVLVCGRTHSRQRSARVFMPYRLRPLLGLFFRWDGPRPYSCVNSHAKRAEAIWNGSNRSQCLRGPNCQTWSGCKDLNLESLAPKASAMPDYATPRKRPRLQAIIAVY